MNVTKIRELEVGKILWDDQVRGLHVRSLPKNKTFYLKYRTQLGVQRCPKIGHFGQFTLVQARSIASHILERVEKGEDPKAALDAAKAEMTVGELYERVLKEHWDKPRFRASNHLSRIKSLWKMQVEPHFKKTPLSQVTISKVREWHASFAGKPYSANRALEMLSKMFTFAESYELRPQGTNPCKLVPHFKEQKRTRHASIEELRAIVRILEREEDKEIRAVAFIVLLMFTGSRPSAIERATWEQLTTFEKDGYEFGILTFFGKSSAFTGDNETVILPPQAMRIINKLPRTSDDSITGIKMPRRVWKMIKDEVGCTDLWARDFRRTFASFGLGGGMGLSTIGELLNHRSTQTTKGYAMLGMEPRVKAALQIASGIEAATRVQ